jgi:hypothetical protein
VFIVEGLHLFFKPLKNRGFPRLNTFLQLNEQCFYMKSVQKVFMVEHFLNAFERFINTYVNALIVCFPFVGFPGPESTKRFIAQHFNYG